MTDVTDLSRLTCAVTLMFERTFHSTQALIDSGSENNLLDPDLATRLDVLLIQLSTPISVSALDGVSLATITHKTTPITLIVSGNHRECLEFYLFPVANHPVILGFPWLAIHNPHIH